MSAVCLLCVCCVPAVSAVPAAAPVAPAAPMLAAPPAASANVLASAAPLVSQVANFALKNKSNALMAANPTLGIGMKLAKGFLGK